MAGLFGARFGSIGGGLGAWWRGQGDRRSLAEVDAAIKAGDVGRAVLAVRRLLAQDALSVGALARLSPICLELDAINEGDLAARRLEDAPDKSVDELIALAEYLHATRRHDAAELHASQALARRATEPRALRVLAGVARATMRFAQEIEYRRRLVEMRPTANSTVALGAALAAHGDAVEAADAFEQALAIDRFSYAAFVGLDRCAPKRADRFVEPDEGADKADNHRFRARVLSRRGDDAAALAALERAGDLADHSDERLALMRAELLHRAGRFEEAGAAYRQIAAAFPASDRAIAGLADLLCDLEDYDGAAVLLDRSERLFASRAGRSRRAGVERTLSARQGRFGAFWSSYRADHAAVAMALSPGQIRYEPAVEDLCEVAGVLFCASWGVGDELCWSSVYGDLAARFERPSITCDPRLLGLFARSYPGVNFVPSARKPKGDLAGGQFDAYRALPDQILSRVFDDVGWRAATSAPAVAMVTDALAAYRASSADFPTKPGALRADPALRAVWKNRLAELPPGPKVGIGWRSGSRNARRDVHYTELHDWGPIFAVEGVTFINLQYGDAGPEVTASQLSGARLVDFADLDLRDDLESTAALISELDLVIAPCTAVAELAGALGAPTIMTANSPALRSRTLDDGRDLWFSNMRRIFGARLFDKPSLIEATATAVRSAFQDGESRQFGKRDV